MPSWASSSRRCERYSSSAQERKLNRLPDYVIVEGPLAGGHLGFGMDWRNTIWRPSWLKSFIHENRTARYSSHCCRGIFTAATPCRFWSMVRQQYRSQHVHRGEGMWLAGQGQAGVFRASEDDIVVTHFADWLPMRMLKNTPALARASVRVASPTATCLTATATAPTSRPITARSPAPDAKTISVMDRLACAPTCAITTAGPAALHYA